MRQTESVQHLYYELAVQLEQSAAPRLKFLLNADDLVPLSPPEQGLQQRLDLTEKYCQPWALAVNPTKAAWQSMCSKKKASIL